MVLADGHAKSVKIGESASLPAFGRPWGEPTSLTFLKLLGDAALLFLPSRSIFKASNAHLLPTVA